ncbi:MAG: LLM class flavin-dependent oxidoreductase [Bacteroidetes bacterium]|nr:LLM class flavin-dependent oxidoreductase [Bacteroidota bacterium]
MIDVRTPDRFCEVAWFDDLCGGDTCFLGEVDPDRRSSFSHCKDILQHVEAMGYDNILLPTSYMDGQETIPFAAAAAMLTHHINLLVAVRTGEIHPPMLARHLATLDHLLNGRLTVNIINSDLPGLREDPNLRYQRCEEVIRILRQAWTDARIEHKGQVYPDFSLDATPVRPLQVNGGPLLYFGGISDGSREVAARHCDVFLMWPEPEQQIEDTMRDMSARAARFNRRIDFGLRIHVIVRETEAEARAYARHIMSRFNPYGFNLKHLAQDAQSAGVLRQDRLREQLSDAEGFIEPHLWMGIGRARSGCGGAIVGDPGQVLAKIERYIEMGVRAFIFSGYPLIEEAACFARHVLPALPRCRLNVVQGRLPAIG